MPDQILYSVEKLLACMNAFKKAGYENVSQAELNNALRTASSGLTPRAADGFTAEQLATIRRIARDVVSGGSE